MTDSTTNTFPVTEMMSSFCLTLPKEMTQSTIMMGYAFFWDVCAFGVIFVTGISGNSLAFYILSRDRSQTRTSINPILKSLAVIDIVFLSCCFFFQFMRGASIFFRWILYYNFTSNLLYPLYGTGMAARMSRNWTIVLISLERYYSVYHPFHVRQYFSPRRIRQIVALIVLMSFIVSIPQYFVPHTKEYLTNCSDYMNVRVVTLDYSPILREWVILKTIYFVIGYNLLCFGFPLVLLCVMNILLIRGVRRCTNQLQAQSMLATPLQPLTQRPRNVACDQGHSQPRNSPEVIQTRQSSTSRSPMTNVDVNRICVVIIIVYIMTESFAVFYKICYFMQLGDITAYLRPVSNFLVSSKSTANFFIYVCLGHAFRKGLRLALIRR